MSDRARTIDDLDVVTPTAVAPEPWANGLGVTRVLVERLAWRISLAEIRGRMPFSHFAGIDRVLIPLSSVDLSLTVDGEEHRVSRRRGIRFPGNVRVTPDTGGAAVSVVNLMVRRPLAEASFEITDLVGSIDVPDRDAAIVILDGIATADGLPLPAGSVLLPTSRPREVKATRAVIARFRISPLD